MSAVVVCRPVNGITINSEMEFVLDGEGCVRIFDSMANARKALCDTGYTGEEMEHILCAMRKSIVSQSAPRLQISVLYL